MSQEEKEKKPELPVKSSMEILSELFSTFHAEPPLIIKKEKSEDSSKKHKKKKKHKHKDKKHKKKEKKKKKSSGSCSDSEVDLARILIKQEKDAAEKKIKIEDTDLILNLKKEKYGSGEEHECDVKIDKSERTSEQNCKIIIKDFSSSKIEALQNKEQETDGEIVNSDSSVDRKHKKKQKHKHKSKKRHRSESREKSVKKIKSEDSKHHSRSTNKKRKHSRDRSKDVEKQRDHSKDSNFYKGYSSKEDRKSYERYRDRSRERDRYKDEFYRELEEYKRYKNKELYKDDGFYKSRDKESDEKEEKWFRRERYRMDSRERDSSTKFDKKKLLEIARKNAITMMKSGSLPGALTLGPQAQEKVIAAIKSGGKTIEELTDFCKTLSKKEEMGELSSLSEKDDSDSDNDKPFHHPFQLKDRPTSITMNIKNSVPLPIKSVVERTSELRMQFPVSSGQQHRKGEEWMPVSPPSVKKAETALPTPVAVEVQATIVPVPIPIPAQVPVPLVHSVASALAVRVPTAVTHIPLPLEAPPDPLLCPVETMPAPPDAPPGPQVFPTSSKPVEQSVDIGSIVSQRLSALRRLQENPNDVQALNQMYKSNQEMQNWATSKQQFGQFTGSTGAQILSQSELSSGYQAWAKKDQLQTAAPVSGGMGMHLLQKMGWKPGEGLGKEKTGALEPLLLEVKLDKRGLVSNEEQPQKIKIKQKKAPATVKNLQGKHPVSLLGEYASKKKLGAPQYILEFECGPDHKKNFLFKVVLNGVEYKPNVVSNNKKEAKAAAATVCLQQIGLLPTPPPTSAPNST